MKRFIIAMALVVFMTGAVSAEGMMFGMKGGLNLANMTGDDVEDNKMKMAFGGGVWMNYAFTEAISLQPELMFMLKGMDYDITLGTETFEGIGKTTYLDLNILGKYSIPMEGNFSPNIFAGPYVGMLMSAEADIPNEAMDDLETQDMKDETKSMDLGVVFGVGFDYMLEEGCITFDVRYAMGLTTIDDSDSDDDMKNTGIMFMVGYGFNF
ncbi:MAG: PorT family protein [Bacteroidales bacterium]|nr:PorT family protein [Candidatus Latescibacterota bacterium]